MRNTFVIFLLLTSCAVSRNSYSQGLHSTSGRAVKVYDEGKGSYENLDYKTAEQQLKEALKYDNNFFEAYMMLGELYTNLNRYSEAASAIKIDSIAYRPVYFRLAYAELMTGEYANALLHYKTYLRNKGNSEKNRLTALKNIRNCEFAIEAEKKPVPFDLINAGNGINTSDDEYWPSITADGQTLMFTRQIYSDHYPQTMGSTQEDFFVSTKSSGIWQKAINAGEPLNTKSNEGAQTLSSNGKYMYFTSCDRAGGLGSCDLYFSAFNNGNWSIPYNLKWPVNSTSWESTPSISADGNILYFSSNRQNY